MVPCLSYLAVMEGTLMLLVPGLPEPLAIVTHPAGDTLSDLRREVTKSIKQVRD